MPLSFFPSETDRVAESIDHHRKIIARLQIELEQIDRALTYHRAELDWLRRCEEIIGGSHSRSNVRALP
jgi:hypothetical protein